MFELIITISVFCIAYATADDQCQASQTDFDNICKTEYNGIVDGGRCFFLGTNNVIWDNAWASCAERGGILAQIQTQGEFDKISKYNELQQPKTSGLNRYAWIARRHKVPYAGTDWFTMLNNSVGYNSVSEPNPKLVGSNNWIRTRASDPVSFVNGEDCFLTWAPAKSDVWTFGDVPCTITIRALCQISNLNSNYTLYGGGKCITEIPCAVYSSITLQKCAMLCAKEPWCRGFNLFKTTSQCELFSWSIYDQPNSAVVSDCFHYTYNI